MYMRYIVLIALFTTLGLAGRAQTKIAASEAKDHIGDSVTVCAMVMGAKYIASGKNAPTLLDMDGKFPNQPLTLVIFKEARDKFPYAPDEKLLDKQICVTGRITEFKGKPQINVTSESQIKIAAR